LHPRADEGNQLPSNEKLKIAMLQGAKARGHERDFVLQKLDAQNSN
jgi:hypothetical protein